MPPPWQWRVTPIAGVSNVVIDEWHALAAATDAPPLARPEFAASYAAAFDHAPHRICLHTLRLNDQLVAALPLRRWPPGNGGWASLSNAHAPYAAFAVRHPTPALGAEILRHLHSDGTVADFTRVYLDAPFTRALQQGATWLGLRMLVDHPDREVCFALRELRPGAAAHGRLKRHVRSLRQMQQLGRVTLAHHPAADGLAEKLQECFDLERRGWKGSAGSPMAAHPDTLSFYTALAERAARQQRLSLFTLHLDGRLVAFDYALRAAGRVDSLKCSFDPAVARCSPGNVLSYLTLLHEHASGEAATYHYGLEDAWKMRWTTQTARVARLRFFAPGLSGALAYSAPALRSGLSRSAWLRAMAARVRAARSMGAPTAGLVGL